MTISPPASARRPGIATAILVLACLAILVWLGVWQLQRLKWKEGLLAHISALKTAPARPLDDVLKGGDLDFVRVSLACPDLMRRPRLRVYGVQDGQAGYRLMTACPDGPGASILVDLGFQGGLDKPACPPQAASPDLNGPVVGVLRRPDRPSFVTAPNQPDQNLWYWRDLKAMAAKLGAGPSAPAFVALETLPGQRTDACGLNRAKLPADIPNNHLQYAITWFGLAAALVGVYVAMLFGRRPG